MNTRRPITPDAAPVLTLHVDIDATIPAVSDERGTSVFIPILGGLATGPDISAEVLPGGGDWAVDRRSGEFVVHARYHLRTDDGAVIGVDNVGVWRERQGGSPYFVTTPRFTAPPGRYDWMNRAVFVGMAVERGSERIDIEVYRLTPMVGTRFD